MKALLGWAGKPTLVCSVGCAGKRPDRGRRASPGLQTDCWLLGPKLHPKPQGQTLFNLSFPIVLFPRGTANPDELGGRPS